MRSSSFAFAQGYQPFMARSLASASPYWLLRPDFFWRGRWGLEWRLRCGGGWAPYWFCCVKFGGGWLKQNWDAAFAASQLLFRTQ